MQVPLAQARIQLGLNGKQTMIFQHKMKGFTLAELLSALVILGIIASFTIPKILNGQQDGRRIAVFKETIAAINQAGYNQALRGNLPRITGNTYRFNQDDLFPYINAIKYCDTDSSAQGCWDIPIQGAEANMDDEPGFIMHNGASVIGLGGASSPSDTAYFNFALDWNGVDGPNILGQDKIRMRFCFGLRCDNGEGGFITTGLSRCASNGCQEIFTGE